MTGGMLVITAHPDDEVLIAGGTLAACAQLSIPTGVVCLTRGETGPIASRKLATRKTLAQVRAQELRDACATLGVGFVRCYRRQDGSLSWADASRIAAQLVGVIDEHRPEVVVSFGEDGLYHHPDHVATYELARKAVRRAGHRTSLYRSIWSSAAMRKLAAELRRRGGSTRLWGLELEDLGTDDELGVDEVVVDVRSFTLQKLTALRCHRTQLDPGNALGSLPQDLAERFLGYERFAAVHEGASQRLFDRLSSHV